MIAVPSGIMSRFQIFLDQKPVPKQFQAHYRKWFRYYWDFCHTLILVPTLERGNQGVAYVD